MNKRAKRLMSIGGPVLAAAFLFGCQGDTYQNAQAELELEIRRAETKADHLALAAYYAEEARLFQRDATWPERIANAYNSNQYARIKEEVVQRCNALAHKSREMAEENLALASIHRQLANEAKQ